MRCLDLKSCHILVMHQRVSTTCCNASDLKPRNESWINKKQQMTLHLVHEVVALNLRG